MRDLGRDQRAFTPQSAGLVSLRRRELARGGKREPVVNTGWMPDASARLFLFARNRPDGHRDSQGLILGVDRWGNDRLPKFRGDSASPFAAREEVGIGNDDPRQSVIHC